MHKAGVGRCETPGAVMTRLDYRLLAAIVLVLAPSVLNAQQTPRTDRRLVGGMTLAYSRSENRPLANERAYTLQPSVDGILGVMQSDVGIESGMGRFAFALVVHEGWFSRDNYQGADKAYRNLQQAWLRFDITPDVSLRAGVMPSHIGYESMNSRDNFILSRLFCSDATPYYETGASMQWHPLQSLSIEGLVLSGWQRIVAVNRNLAWGSRINWKPDTTLSITWGTFYGNMEDRTATRQRAWESQAAWRFYNNFWVEWKPMPDLTLVGIADVGRQQLNGDSTATTWCMAAIAALQIHPKCRLGARAEYFSDPASIMFATPTGPGFVTSSLSCNVDLAINRSTTLRGEIRRMFSADNIFPSSTGLQNSDVFGTITVNYSVSSSNLPW
ncbi:MAG: hypothetical protein FGM32_00945 [Candidatus Kapabacteria bacterium]|nr:hypothetical protein [Candidatus Kapabacteria bacterium]